MVVNVNRLPTNLREQKNNNLSEMRTIKLIGIGSEKDRKLAKNLKVALQEIGEDFNVKEIKKVSEIFNYEISKTPAILLDDIIISQGEVISPDEIVSLLST